MATFDAWEDFFADRSEIAIGKILSTADGMAFRCVADREDFRRADGRRFIWLRGKPVVVIAIGQSQAQSVSTQTGGDKATNHMVYVWNNGYLPGGGVTDGKRFIIARFGRRPFTPGEDEGDANNKVFHACSEIQKRLGVRVYLFLIARHAHPIEAFMSEEVRTQNAWPNRDGTVDLRSHLIRQLSAAMPRVPGKPKTADFLIISQGEANATNQVETYARKMKAVVDDFEELGYIDTSKTPIVACEIHDGGESGRMKRRHASALRRLRNDLPTLRVVSASGLKDNGDGVHYDGRSLVTYGLRIADAAFTHQRYDVLDPISCDLTVDGGLDWITDAQAEDDHYEGRPPLPLEATPLRVVNHETLGWCYAPRSLNVSFGSRAVYEAPRDRELLIELDIATGNQPTPGRLAIGAAQYNSNGQLTSIVFGRSLSVPIGAHKRYSVRIIPAHARQRDGTISLDETAKRFAPVFRFTQGKGYPSLRFNIVGFTWVSRPPRFLRIPGFVKKIGRFFRFRWLKRLLHRPRTVEEPAQQE
ncbi:hypothetical protein MRS76_11185 [Rhizobiaceae bacterium n13]|uniref:sialate O-acetylesterase n=1 Tax=Ferirhizobium litorale TaxID=2927786 RepID=UPI0024B2A473|nr:sialate O-acetylesterase [Fererhizobium litorale]MDI7862524.1 hypothetical protein [Fererhizobium litorale]